MNLDIGILWIEDSFDAQEEESLRRRVQDTGFIARIENIKNGTGLEEIAQSNRYYHLYDIILLDYKLQNEYGDNLAPQIRELFPYTTILFYSGSEDVDSLRLKISKKKVEGVYCSERTRFVERAGILIDQTAKALDRLSGMRGLAMKVVAECDEVMRGAVLSMSARDSVCASKITDLDADVVAYLSDVSASYQTATANDLADRLGTRAVDSAKLFKHFRRLTQVAVARPASFGLSSEEVERLRELRRSNANYDPQVLKKRNLLGHVVEVQGDRGWILKGSDEIAVSDFPDIRRAFASHTDAVREMNALLTRLDG